MTEFRVGDKVRVNEGALEGSTGYVTGVEDNLTHVELENVTYVKGSLAFYTATLVRGDEDHEALAYLKNLYPDYLKSDNYRFRLTTFVGGIMYVSSIPLDAGTLTRVLRNPPAGLCAVEFMLRLDDPTQEMSWKLLWTA